MRALVFGAGAIGSLLGHRLAQAGHDVVLVGRPGYVHAVQERGLILENGRPPNRHVVHPSVVVHLSEIPLNQRQWDIVLLTVKAYDTREAAQELLPYISNEMPILIVQNGVGGEEAAKEVLQEAALISGVLTLSVSVLAPGHIRLETTRGGLNLAPIQKDTDANQWALLFSAAGFRTATFSDYRAMKWSKLLLNILANAIPAILGMTPGAVFADPALFAIERAAFLEAWAVMRAMHLTVVSFPRYPVPLLVWAMRYVPAFLLRPLLTRLVTSGRGEKMPSLYLDLASGRQRSEVLYLNGAVASHAQRLGLDTPVNRILCDLLTSIANGQMHWEEFRNQPQKLIEWVYRASAR